MDSLPVLHFAQKRSILFFNSVFNFAEFLFSLLFFSSLFVCFGCFSPLDSSLTFNLQNEKTQYDETTVVDCPLKCPHCPCFQAGKCLYDECVRASVSRSGAAKLRRVATATSAMHQERRMSVTRPRIHDFPKTWVNSVYRLRRLPR